MLKVISMSVSNKGKKSAEELEAEADALLDSPDSEVTPKENNSDDKDSDDDGDGDIRITEDDLEGDGEEEGGEGSDDESNEDTVPDPVPVPAPVPVVPKTEDTEDEKDRKLRESGSEAQRLYFKNKQMAEAYEDAQKVTITDDEVHELMRKDGIDPELASPSELALFKKNALIEKRLAVMSRVHEEQKQVDAWADKVEDFIASVSARAEAKYAPLASNSSKFRSYCMKKDRVGQHLEDLLASFLFNLPASSVPNTTIFNSRGGASRAPQTPAKKGIPVDTLKKIRTTDSKKMNDLLRESALKGKDLDVDID